MQLHYRVTSLVSSNDFWPVKSILARERGNQLHSIIAKQWGGSGRYIEKPQSGLLVDTEGRALTTITGTPDMYYFEGNNLIIVDHKTVSVKDRMYCKREWWDQLTLYALLIMAFYAYADPNFVIDNVVLQIWHYKRQLTIEDSLKVEKRTILPPMKANEIVDSANLFLSDYFKIKVSIYSILAARVSLPS